ncbi:Ldh family oxidoreductase [Mucilaginibacter sp.]|uniref:Ldh family oxidoreductase n=1 Tax=Mucilaginibacter sp. TaxID=1882438 RepID=UPI002615CEC6|nr:Ldh family oxidoreductase [Mucilaginibacter sp.]MDB4926304.1 putative Uncharacterized oxidoreductase yjmC [Mucilaginibacter sp.]
MVNYFIDHNEAVDWAVKLFVARGLELNDAQTLATSLTTTSLWGTDSHGIARITHYLSRFSTGSIKVKPQITFNKTAVATGIVDGDDGHGIIILHEAAKQAIALAKEAGAGVVGVKNSSHCGAIGLYTRQIAAAGMVGIAFTHSDSFVVPHGGKKPFFGTNPISIAFPVTDAEKPICLDMATSIIPWNYIMNAKRENGIVPKGYGVDNEGNDCVTANDIIAVKPTALHKGYAMAFLIDMLCGPLNGMGFGPELTPMYDDLDKARKLGSLVIAIDPEKFGGLEYVKAVGTRAIETVKQYGDNILFPGEPEYLSKANRLANGIPVTEALAAEFAKWSKNLSVVPPTYK